MNGYMLTFCCYGHLNLISSFYVNFEMRCLASSTCLVSHLLLFFFRWTLESLAQLEPRRSALEDDFEEEEEKDEDEQLTTGLDDGHDKVCVLVFVVITYISI